jgi:hypothetical protein
MLSAAGFMLVVPSWKFDISSREPSATGRVIPVPAAVRKATRKVENFMVLWVGLGLVGLYVDGWVYLLG